MPSLFKGNECRACDLIRRKEVEDTLQQIAQLPDRLRAADVSPECLYAHDVEFRYVRRLFSERSICVDQFTPVGYGWDIGSFDWESLRIGASWRAREAFATVVVYNLSSSSDPYDARLLSEGSVFRRAKRLTDKGSTRLVIEERRVKPGEFPVPGSISGLAELSAAQEDDIMQAVDDLISYQ